MVNTTSQEQKLSQRGKEEYAGSLKMEGCTPSKQPKCWIHPSDSENYEWTEANVKANKLLNIKLIPYYNGLEIQY